MHRVTTALALGMSTMALGTAGCGSDETRTVTAATPALQAEATPMPVLENAVLIQTRISDAQRHVGTVLAASVIGESVFCQGGRVSGSSDGPTITSTFRCSDGTLVLKYAPTQPKLVQGNPWEIVRGTGRYEGLRGGGTMVVRFEADDPDRGREYFTGTAGR